MTQLSDHFDYKRLIRFTLPSIFSMIIGSVYSIVDGFFVSNFVGKATFDIKALTQACSNGMSSFLSSISSSVVGMLFNYQLMTYAGPDGVAAYGVIMYVEMIFLSASFGYTSGISPVFSYHYGAQNTAELKNLLKRSLVIIRVFSVFIFGLAQLLAQPLTDVFTSYDSSLMAMTTHAFRVYSFNFIVSGMGIFGSTLFAALNNGGVASVLSFLRLVVYQGGFVMLLPAVFGINGIWSTMTIANTCSAITALIFIAAYRKNTIIKTKSALQLQCT